MIKPENPLSRRTAFGLSIAAFTAGLAAPTGGPRSVPHVTSPWLAMTQYVPELQNPDLDRLLHDIAVAWRQAWDDDILAEEDDRVTCQLAGDLA
jgi:hypothetical protein